MTRKSGRETVPAVSPRGEALLLVAVAREHGPHIELHVRHMPGGKFTDHVFTAMKEYWGGRRPADLYLDDWVQAKLVEMPNLKYVPVISDALPTCARIPTSR